MGGTGVIDRFLGVFTQYIDSGFGLLQPEVAFVATTLIAIDLTLAALFWSWGGDNDIIARLVKKTLFVGVFAYLIGNWNSLARIVFESFSGLGLKAAGSGLSAADFLRPGRVAQVGLDAGRPLLDSISGLMGYISFFENFIQIMVLLFAWVILLLAVIVGIGSTLFSQFTSAATGAQPSIDDAMAMVLAALSLLGLGIFGPGIANGLVSGGPQLGAGAAGGATAAYRAGGASGVATTGLAKGADAVMSPLRRAAGSLKSSFEAAGRATAGEGSPAGADGAASSAASSAGNPPAWARRMKRAQTMNHGTSAAAHAVRSGDHGGGGASVDLSQGE